MGSPLINIFKGTSLPFVTYQQGTQGGPAKAKYAVIRTEADYHSFFDDKSLVFYSIDFTKGVLLGVAAGEALGIAIRITSIRQHYVSEGIIPVETLVYYEINHLSSKGDKTRAFHIIQCDIPEVSGFKFIGEQAASE